MKNKLQTIQVRTNGVVLNVKVREGNQITTQEIQEAINCQYPRYANEPEHVTIRRIFKD